MDLFSALGELRQLVIMRDRVLEVANKLKQVHSCPAAVIEAQTCQATIDARWAARELMRIIKETEQ